MDPSQQFTSPRHLTFAEAAEKKGKVLPTDRVVIPARNEAGSIGSTIGYLMQAGFGPAQILIMVNHTVDNTAEVAAKFGVCVSELDSVLTPEVTARLESEFGVTHARLKGKGTAMFAAGLELERVKTSPEARIFFLDADITNLDEVSPIGLLLAGWESWNGDIRMIKLASQGRNNEGILAFLGLPRTPYVGIGALQWPLCGQMSLRQHDWRLMRGATGYSIEMAMLMDLLERNGTPSVFGEVALGATLRDKKNTDHVHTIMYRSIFAYVTQLLQTGGWKKLHCLDNKQITELNHDSGQPHPFWVPQKLGNGVATFESAFGLDAILPSVAEFVGM